MLVGLEKTGRILDCSVRGWGLIISRCVRGTTGGDADFL